MKERTKRQREPPVGNPSAQTTTDVGDRTAGQYDTFFQFLLGIDERTFFRAYFEKKPLHFKRGGPKDFFRKTTPPLCSSPLNWSGDLMRTVCRDKEIMFSTDVNIVKYKHDDKKRVPFQLSGRVDEPTLTSCVEQGWSVRFLRPHEHSPSMAEMVSAIEEVFQCSSGVNSYWTPKGTQGFAPHYDDVDVYLLQLEGSKRWRLHEAPLPSDKLSRHSSEDYKPEDIGPAIVTTTLRAGDVLYMPRGTVHQGDTYATDPQEDSLHVTFSAFQMHSMADMLLRITQFQIETLAANNVEWRRGIPRTWFRTLGAAYGRAFAEETGVCALRHDDAAIRAANLKQIRALVAELSDVLQSAAAIDNGVDRYAQDVLAKAQPPVATSFGASCAAYPQLTLDSSVRLASSNCVRLVMYVPNEAQVYHNGHNSRVCLETSLGHLRFEREFAAAVATLMTTYPASSRVGDLPMPFEEEQDANDNRLLLVQTLLEANVLVAE
jgi:bifunctional lysine-specific demethylase and histidyl-hydroxylase NO66